MFALGINLGEVSAHIVFCITRNFGNVSVSINTYSDDNADINDLMIFGQLAELLSKHLKYDRPIFVDFETHQYADNCFPNFLVSCGKKKYKYYRSETVKTKSNLPNDAIIIRHAAKKFQIQSALKLVEYAILNRKEINLKQEYLTFDKKYCFEYKVKSINPLMVKEVLDAPNSDLLNLILKAKINIPSQKNEEQNISYYWKNNRYYLFWKKDDNILLDIENIYDLKRLKDSSVVIFDSDSSFYYIKYPKVSQRQVIEKVSGYSWFEVENKDSVNLLIYLFYYRYFEEKTDDKVTSYGTKLCSKRWTYLIKEDELILDWEEKDWK